MKKISESLYFFSVLTLITFLAGSILYTILYFLGKVCFDRS